MAPVRIIKAQQLTRGETSTYTTTHNIILIKCIHDTYVYISWHTHTYTGSVTGGFVQIWFPSRQRRLFERFESKVYDEYNIRYV